MTLWIIYSLLFMVLKWIFKLRWAFLKNYKYFLEQAMTPNHHITEVEANPEGMNPWAHMLKGTNTRKLTLD
jgi:hypothetical protein